MTKNKKSSKHTAEKSSHKAEDNFPLPDFNKMPEVIPDEFIKIIQDFTEDIAITFPEYKPIMDKWWNNKEAALRVEHSGDPERLEVLLKEEKDNKTKLVFLHCLHVIPSRFFDILYKNESMFEEGSDINTEFLPGIVFKYLWSCDISENTRDTIWKYLQLLLFSIINCVKSREDFGESAKLFEAIDENELKRKLEETLSSMQDMFNFDETENSGENAEGDGQTPFGPGNINMENMPSAENVQEHIQKMMQGKLGKLAMELAEETAEELNLDMDNVGSANDVFKKLFKNPGKLMGVVKNLGSKLDDKIKSGEIKESELISESMEMLNNMKNMPGMNNMHEMFSKMGMPGMPGMGKGKVNMNAMEAQMQKNLKMAQMKERMKKKVSANQNASAPEQSKTSTNASSSSPLTDEQLFSVFSKGEKMEKTPRRAKPSAPPASDNVVPETTSAPSKKKK